VEPARLASAAETRGIGEQPATPTINTAPTIAQTAALNMSRRLLSLNIEINNNGQP